MNLFKQLAIRLKEVFSENSQYLSSLDSLVGDGDHGVTISRGFEVAAEKVELLDEDSSPDRILKEIGYGMLESMGGASGPIFSTIFIQASIAMRDKRELQGSILSNILKLTKQAICDLAGTMPGEKTMVDALEGAIQEISTLSEKDTLSRYLEFAVIGTEKGAYSTINMVATKGRAKFLGERSKGSLDAGSWSVVLIMRTFKEVFST